MELRVLRYFLSVAANKSISKTAKQLHITQPTLSRQIQELEEELGVSLLIRDHHRIRLSPKGEVFAQRASEIVKLCDKVQEEFSKKMKGTLSIGCIESNGSKEMAQWIAKFHRQFPEVHFEIFSADSQEIKQKLEAGLLDLGFLIEPVEKEEYEWIRLRSCDLMGLILLREDPLAKKKHIQKEDVYSLPLFLPYRKEVRKEILRFLEKEEKDLQIVGSSRLFSNVGYLVEQKMGYAIGVDGIIGLAESDKLVFRPFSPEIKMRTIMVWRKGRLLSPVAEAFLEFVKKELKT
ncbi:LysR family transcriptional regulator [Dubosiella newyorkensis]|uniref:LysR family transcriptional regulator n=1 Tax=Dubosiella newyorkensis TaxID=1862672 RepID=UPI00272DD1D6|nr:LysR family transcriptional regulator [Dubosiella newyorkensis]